MAASSRQVSTILNVFNSFHHRLQFTMEVEQDGAIPFLDVLVSRDSQGYVCTDWYHKPSWSGRYCNFASNLPIQYKKNTISMLTRKAITLSHPSFHQKNLEIVKKTLVEYSYPVKLVDEIMGRTVMKLSQPPPPPATHDDASVPSYISIPYDKIFFGKVRDLLAPYNIKVVARPHTTLRSLFFTRLKDKVDKALRSNVVYKITCECDALYIGNTKQHLKKRFTQHKHGSATHSALSKHLQESNHNINFDDVKILCTENNEKIRDVMEMIYIRSHNCLNLQTDTATLSKCYNHLIQCFP